MTTNCDSFCSGIRKYQARINPDNTLTSNFTVKTVHFFSWNYIKKTLNIVFVKLYNCSPHNCMPLFKKSCTLGKQDVL